MHEPDRSPSRASLRMTVLDPGEAVVQKAVKLVVELMR